MMTVPPENRVKEIRGPDSGSNKLVIERAPDVQWCIESDAFKLRTELKQP